MNTTPDPRAFLDAATTLATRAQEQADKAAEGPWERDGECVAAGDYFLFDHMPTGDSLIDNGVADAEFVAASRSLVPDLAARLRQTTTALHAVLDLCDDWQRNAPHREVGCAVHDDFLHAVVSALDGGATVPPGALCAHNDAGLWCARDAAHDGPHDLRPGDTR